MSDLDEFFEEHAENQRRDAAASDNCPYSQRLTIKAKAKDLDKGVRNGWLNPDGSVIEEIGE